MQHDLFVCSAEKFIVLTTAAVEEKCRTAQTATTLTEIQPIVWETRTLISQEIN